MKTPKAHISALTISAAAAMLIFSGSCSRGDSASGEQQAPVVDVATARQDSVTLSKTYPGVVKASNSADVVARVNGTVVKQHFQSGASVRRGQVLFSIEDTRYRDAVTQAEAALENARGALAYASKNYEAMNKALQSDAVAQIQVLQSQSALEEAKANVKNCEAALSTARTQLGYCTIRAPFDGVMTTGAYSEGAYIGGEGAPVKMSTIYDNSVLYAEFAIDDAAFLRSFTCNGNRDLIDYDSVPVAFTEPLPHPYAGRLSYISPDVNTGTGTLTLRVRLDNRYGELRDGMYCTVNLPVRVEPRATVVNDAAIGTSQTDKYLYVVNDSNTVVYQPVTLGDLADDSTRIITSGIAPGTRYVTKALLKVRSGMKVTPREQ